MITDVIDVIQKQIDETTSIMKKLSFLRPVPVRHVPGAERTNGKVRYDKTTIEQLENEINAWQIKTKSVLSACFGSDSEYKKAFERTFSNSHGLYLDAKKELKSELNNGVTALSGIIEEESLKSKLEQKENANQSIPAKAVKQPLVFISHAGDDKAIIHEFIVHILKNGIGLTDEDIVCTSFEWTTLPTGNNIPNYIRDNIQNTKVVLAMVSRSFKKSEVCQNEVGAAWALNNIPMSIVLPDTDFNELGWIFSLDKALKIDSSDSLNKFQIDFCNRVGITPKPALNWSPCVNSFLEALNKLPKPETEAQQVTADATVVKQLSGDGEHDRKLFDVFDKAFPEEKVNYCLNNIQTSTHYSDYDLTIWLELIHWLDKVSNKFIDVEIQTAASELGKHLQELVSFTSQYYGPDRISWSTEPYNNVTPEKWREIHEAKIYRWEPSGYDSKLFHEREKIVMGGLPQMITNIETSYNSFRMIVKTKLFI